MSYPIVSRTIASEHGFSVSMHRCNAQRSTVFHFHDCIEVEMILQGNGIHRTKEHEKNYTVGDCWIIGTANCHSIDYQSDTVLVSIAISPDFLPPALLRSLLLQAPLFCTLSEKDFTEAKRILMRLTNQEVSDTLSTLLDSALLTELLVFLCRRMQLTDRTPPNLVEKALILAETEFAKGLSLASAAEKLCVSPNYLSALFRRHTNITFTAHLVRLRLRHACHMLDNSRESVSAIAAACGFSSVEYFHAFFKKNMGMSPAAYRHRESF